MKIAILGYGKMGKTIERLASGEGHQIVLKIDAANSHELTAENLQKADVAIDFSLPQTAFSNISVCLQSRLPVVCGTTGWLDRYEEVCALCKAKKGTFFYASNFSIGVNIFFALNERLAQLMTSHSQYSSDMTEIHHTQKLDAPSGTAISLAEGILGNNNRFKDWVLLENPSEKTVSASNIPIYSERVGKTPGTHIVRYKSPIDQIEIKHEAFGREGFAMGAIMAAQWLIGKEGVFGMRDLLAL